MKVLLLLKWATQSRSEFRTGSSISCSDITAVTASACSSVDSVGVTSSTLTKMNSISAVRGTGMSSTISFIAKAVVRITVAMVTSITTTAIIETSAKQDTKGLKTKF